MEKNYKEYLQQITTFIFDVDGVLTDGTIIITTNGDMHRIMHTKDGFGLKTAIDEGFNDLLNHQLAMQAGIQASLTEILKQFDPATIEKQFSEGLVLQKKSKCWEKYTQVHEGLAETAVDDFFGDAFSDAYEQQMRVLKK